jgi:hypothetical protein
MENLKDRISTICGIILLISGCILTVSTAGVALPVVVTTYATLGASISGGVLAYLTGKNPDGSTKTASQINEQLKSAEPNK